MLFYIPTSWIQVINLPSCKGSFASDISYSNVMISERAPTAEYNHAAYSKNVTPILNNDICGVDIFKITPLFKICDTYAAMLYLVPFRRVCRDRLCRKPGLQWDRSRIFAGSVRHVADHFLQQSICFRETGQCKGQ